MNQGRFDGLTIAAIAFLCFIAYHAFQDSGVVQIALASSDHTSLAYSSPPVNPSDNPVLTQAERVEFPVELSNNINAIAAPYESYVLTQTLHGFDYGHMAIDISAGKGAVIKSPIHGVVTALFVDDLGNTWLVLENERYQVTLLHGIYTVQVGEMVTLGQPIGTESNQGNTVDALGRSCRGRDCGYHTHLNIFDKQLGVNVNPFEVLGIPPQ